MKPFIWSVINIFKEESLARSRMQSAATMDTLQDSNPGRTEEKREEEGKF